MTAAFRRSAAVFAALVALSLPFAVSAQGTYVPPKLLKQGTSTSPVAGPGTVIVKVLVNANGSFKVQNIIKSTNHGNDAPALEIARTSRYKAAIRDGKAVLAFYDFSLKFTGKSVSAVESGESGDLGRYDEMLNASNFSGAKAGLTEYIGAHPSDAQALLLLGTAQVGLKEYEDAAKSFDSAGTIPQKYQTVASVAYAQYAAEQANANNAAAAVAAAKKAAQLSSGVSTYNLLGFAEIAAGDPQSAITDLQKAASLAASDSKTSNKERAVIQGNLASAYAHAGDLDKAKAAAAEATRLDPGSTAGSNAIATYYVQKAQDLESSAKLEEAAAQYEAAAAALPEQAVTLYSRAAFVYLNVKPNPDNAKAKADADKALAIDANNARANFAAGVALANQGNTKDALTFLNKADAAAKAGNDASLTSSIESAIKQIGGSK